MQATISEQMDKILDSYEDKVKMVGHEGAKFGAGTSMRQLRVTSPARPGRAYARSWSIKEDGNGYIVHNKKHYQLTHLLEFGHVIKNGKGTYGRTRAFHHIGPAEEAGAMQMELYIKVKLK